MHVISLGGRLGLGHVITATGSSCNDAHILVSINVFFFNRLCLELHFQNLGNIQHLCEVFSIFSNLICKVHMRSYTWRC